MTIPQDLLDMMRQRELKLSVDFETGALVLEGCLLSPYYLQVIAIADTMGELLTEAINKGL